MFVKTLPVPSLPELLGLDDGDEVADGTSGMETVGADAAASDKGGLGYRRLASFSEDPKAPSLLRLAAMVGEDAAARGRPDLLAPGDVWDIGYELLSPCKACSSRLGCAGSAGDDEL